MIDIKEVRNQESLDNQIKMKRCSDYAEKVYLVNLMLDTGCNHEKKICILKAVSDDAAKQQADRYINSHLHGENFAEIESVTEVDGKDCGIIYQDCF